MKKRFNFYNLNKKVTALAPLDGYTDCAFREIVKEYGNPDLVFTEFVNVKGILMNPSRVIDTLRYTEFQRPIIAQIFGSDPVSFNKAAILLCMLGFDGVNLNMGCPAKKVASRGAGAALIQSPKLAYKIIEATRKGIRDYQNGKRLSRFESILEDKKRRWNVIEKLRREITLSVKTRIGFSKNNILKWIENLTEADFIIIHGRTFKQKYSGDVNLEAIKQAVSKVTIPIIGNGNITSYNKAVEMFEKTGCAGIMIGRGALGRPWVFKREDSVCSDFEKVKKIIIKHGTLFSKIEGEGKFYEFRKHLSRYLSGFRGAKKLRVKGMKVENLSDLICLFKD